MKLTSLTIMYENGIYTVYSGRNGILAHIYSPLVAEAFFQAIYGHRQPLPENVVKLDEFRKRPDPDGPKGA